MRVAFYSPLKPPDHPVPSGDRRMARLLIQALELAGNEVELPALRLVGFQKALGHVEPAVGGYLQLVRRRIQHGGVIAGALGEDLRYMPGASADV